MLVEPGTNKMIFLNEAAKELEINSDDVLKGSLEMGQEDVTHSLE